MGATLKLRPDKAPDPVFDPDENTAEVQGPEGTRLLQLKYLFDKAHNFVGLAPQNMWMAPMSDVQRRNLRIQRMKNAAFFENAKPRNRNAAIPQKIIDAERENARARAAETQAA
jgi:hypothetical protein